MEVEECSSREDVFTRMSTFVSRNVTRASRSAQEFMSRHFHGREENPSEKGDEDIVINPPNYNTGIEFPDGREAEKSEGT